LIESVYEGKVLSITQTSCIVRVVKEEKTLPTLCFFSPPLFRRSGGETVNIF
jgi:hypothetical protein